MNPSYCRIRVPKEEAIRRFAEWSQIASTCEPVRAKWLDAGRLATDERGLWKGNAVFVSDLGEWTLFEDLSGCLSAIHAEAWRKFAGSDDLVFAGYNDAIGYGELIVIDGGQVLREFLYDEQQAQDNVDAGKLDSKYEPIKNWIEVASFVDADALGVSKDEGYLWVY